MLKANPCRIFCVAYTPPRFHCDHSTVPMKHFFKSIKQSFYLPINIFKIIFTDTIFCFYNQAQSLHLIMDYNPPFAVFVQ